MTRGVSDYAVVYDISDDKERSRVQKALKNFGFRVQKSVFECRMDRAGVRTLVERLERMKIATGFIKIYRLEYSTRPAVIGDGGVEEIDSKNAFII